MPHVVVVGSINMDLVVRLQRLPRPGQTVVCTIFKPFPGARGQTRLSRPFA